MVHAAGVAWFTRFTPVVTRFTWVVTRFTWVVGIFLYLHSMSALTDRHTAWRKYHHLWRTETAGPRTLLLKEGNICRRMYVIAEGCVRYWFNHDGKEISFQFSFEGDVVYSSESFRKNIPSPFSIETIEPVTLRWLNQEDMQLVRQDLELYPLLIEGAADKQAAFLRHFFSYLRDSPQQRYENLVRDQPEIVRRVPLQYIASYLGITPVSLSRIRNRV